MECFEYPSNDKFVCVVFPILNFLLSQVAYCVVTALESLIPSTLTFVPS